MLYKKYSIIFFLLLSFIFITAQTEYKIIASVNNQIITNIDIKNEIEVLKILNKEKKIDPIVNIKSIAFQNLVEEKIKNYVIENEKKDLGNINLNNYIEEEIKQKHGINNLTTKRLIEARIGQGYFKKKLFERSNFCLITGIKNNLYLEAAHIKPWSRSNDYEKLDPKNGILLTPNCHKLFDRGMITFSNNGKLIKSTKIKNDILDILLIENKKVDRSILLDTQTNKYLDWHRENIYEKL